MDLFFKEQATKSASSSSQARNIGEDDGYSDL